MLRRAHRMASLRARAVSWLVAVWLAAAWLTGCEPAAPPAERPVADSPASQSPAPASSAAERPAAENPPGGGAGRGAGAAGFDAGEVKPVGEYLREPWFAAADLERGELLGLACQPCHTLGAGQPALLGPNLHGVFGRTAATQAGFVYTDALKRSGIVWTPRTLDAWLADPAGFVKGTSMGFGGYRSATDRRDLLAYLMTATSSADGDP